jgi:hypothetical protein
MAILLAGSLIFGAGPSWAGPVGVTGDVATPSKPLKVAGGTNALYAFSIQTAPVNSPANQVANLLTRTGAKTTTAALGQAPGVEIKVVSKKGATTTYGSPPLSTVGKDNMPKPVAPVDSVTARSESGDPTKGVAEGQGLYVVGPGTIRAEGFLNDKVVGAAAGAAYDPFHLGGGTISNYEYTINAAFQLDKVNDSGGLVFFAVDSRFSDPETFYDRGEPLSQALWWLSIAGSDVVGGRSDLAVQFHINDAARESGILNPIISDASIAKAVQDNFEMNGGTLQLTNFNLFPDGTTFNVGSGIDYAVGVNGAVSYAVPEPPALLLLCSGVVLGLAACRSRSHEEPRCRPPGN